MNARHALLLIALPLALAGCGNKGPLVMPEPAVEEAPETEPGTVPVEVDVPETLPADDPGGALPDPTAADPLLDDTGTSDPMQAPVDPAPGTADEPASDADPAPAGDDDGADADGNG